MAATTVSGSLTSSFAPSLHKHLSLFSRLIISTRFDLRPSAAVARTVAFAPFAAVRPGHQSSAPSRPFAAGSDNAHKPPSLGNPKLVNFSLSDSEDEEAEGDGEGGVAAAADKAKFPPPYDPFSKKPAVEEPEDPKNLQEVFHKMRTEGLNDYAVKMFDALSKDGCTHEALELFSQIKDKGHMPDIVAHTAVIEAYCNADRAKRHSMYSCGCWLLGSPPMRTPTRSL
ncbi:hypothetical protein BT93_B0971 [Corymbia citriodora subsp. variegata]|nr:hypothetical protein BT93_B0971 [Corymbia citriodora subsp. variegata]